MTNKRDAETFVQESSNNFHSKVVRSFRDNEWHTLVSPYYLDSLTDKPREIDLITEKSLTRRGYHSMTMA